MSEVFKSEQGGLIVPCSCSNWECGQLEFTVDWYEFPTERVAYASIRSRPSCRLSWRLKSAWEILRGRWMEHYIELDATQTAQLSEWLASVKNKDVPKPDAPKLSLAELREKLSDERRTPVRQDAPGPEENKEKK